MRSVVMAGLGLVYFFSISTVAFADEVEVEVHKTRLQDLDILAILVNWLPMAFLIAVWIYFMRSMKGLGRTHEVQKRCIEWMDKTEKLLEELVQIQKDKK